jgi:HK97 gp10 family phage protein
MKDGDTVVVYDHTEQVLHELDGSTVTALEKIGLLAEGYAQVELTKPKAHGDGSVRPNIETGLLHNSITHAIDGQPPAKRSYESDNERKKGRYTGSAPKDKQGSRSVYIGTNVNYAPYVEMGTSKTRAYPFIKPAVEDHFEEYERIFLSSLGK